jgi:hypothetical protein
MTPSTLALLLLTLVTGVVATWLGWRGRRLDHAPICRGCGFDLTGVVPEGKTCPECGSGLARPKAVREGRRRRIWPLVALGLALTGVPLSLLGITGYAALTGDNLTRYMPVGALLTQARHGNPEAITNAGRELVARLKAGDLSDTQKQKVIGAILDIQGDPAVPWDESLGDFIEDSRISGDLDDALYQRFLNQAMVFEFATRPIIAAGDPVPVSVTKAQDRVGSGSAIYAHIEIRELGAGNSSFLQQERVVRGRSGGLTRSTNVAGYMFSAWGSASGTSGGTTTQYLSRQPQEALTLGPQTLEIEYTVRGQLYVLGRPPTLFADSDKGRDYSARIGFEVAPEGQRDLELVPQSEEMNTRLVREVGVQARFFEGRQTTGLNGMMISFDFSHLPVSLAHDVFVVVGDSELRVGSVQQNAADRAQPAAARRWGFETGLGQSLFSGENPSVTVILRPNLDLALDRPDLLGLYDGEVSFSDIRIERR